jgi:regulator of sigma E protease
MSFMISLLPTIIVLGVLIAIHEYGHFLACRSTGVNVEKFSIGFGPEILKWTGKSGTEYVIALFPLGGFVKPAGEQFSDVEGGEPKKGDYLAASLSARILIVCAGVIMNYLLAFVIFSGIFMIGRPVPGTTIGSFVEGYPAAQSELREGDRVLQVNSENVTTWKELTDIFKKSDLEKFELLVVRDGSEKPQTISIQPKVEIVKDVFGKEVNVRRIGIIPNPEANEFEKYSFGEAIVHSFKTVWTMSMMTHKAMFYLVTGRLSMDAISGPVGIIAMTGDAAKLGLPYLLQLMATLSVSLAVLNLLPVPALDGGHLLFLIIEGIRKKPVSFKLQERFTQLGFSLLLLLMVFLVYNDLDNLRLFDKVKGLFGV